MEKEKCREGEGLLFVTGIFGSESLKLRGPLLKPPPNQSLDSVLSLLSFITTTGAA